MKWSVIDGKPAWLVTGDYASLSAACLARLLAHVECSARRELDRAREALREAGEGLVRASVDLARFRVERPAGGAS